MPTYLDGLAIAFFRAFFTGCPCGPRAPGLGTAIPGHRDWQQAEHSSGLGPDKCCKSMWGRATELSGVAAVADPTPKCLTSPWKRAVTGPPTAGLFCVVGRWACNALARSLLRLAAANGSLACCRTWCDGVRVGFAGGR